uniref:Uncharacterized protein n=1 Tax=Dicentrarchus labrax TaxID=13489 RepID=A0A8P4KDU2_DICLA
SSQHRDIVSDVSVDASGALEMIDTYDRPGKAFGTWSYADAGTYANASKDKPMERIPKAGAYAGAGVGLAGSEWGIFNSEAKGPNVRAGATASLASGARAFANAEVASVCSQTPELASVRHMWRQSFLEQALVLVVEWAFLFGSGFEFGLL